VKPREPRRTVLIRARMRTGSAWGGVNLLNLSSRGALAQAEASPPKGSYIEIRRGAQVIVARVVWAEAQRFGLRTQDPIGIDDILADRDGSSSTGPPGQRHSDAERRAAPRPNGAARDRHEQSRLFARCLEYSCMAGFGAVMAVAVLDLARAALAGPLSQVGAALALQ